jgi:nitrite reductase/ring-hydroxylating ferredoxin subunit
MAFSRICKIEEVPIGEMRKFGPIDKEILVANGNGRFYCLAARCTHGGAPLVEGVLNGDTLECPWHDAAFRLADGAVLFGPPKVHLKVYPCVVRGKYLYVEMQPTT